MIMVILMIANLGDTIPYYNLVTQIIMWVALILTIISLVDYIVKNKDVMSGDM